jgi:hypothetical protein
VTEDGHKLVLGHKVLEGERLQLTLQDERLDGDDPHKVVAIRRASK